MRRKACLHKQGIESQLFHKLCSELQVIMSSKLLTDSFKQIKSRNLQPTKHKTQTESSNNREIVGKTDALAGKRGKYLHIS